MDIGSHYPENRGKEKEKKNILNFSRTINAKAKAQKEYVAADKEVKASVKKGQEELCRGIG